MCISIATAILIVSAPGPINAQTLIETSKLKCKDYLGAPVDRREWFAAWISGYYNAERNMPVVDFGNSQATIRKLKSIAEAARTKI
jgi:hypothetical protein